MEGDQEIVKKLFSNFSTFVAKGKCMKRYRKCQKDTRYKPRPTNCKWILLECVELGEQTSSWEEMEPDGINCYIQYVIQAEARNCDAKVLFNEKVKIINATDVSAELEQYSHLASSQLVGPKVAGRIMGLIMLYENLIPTKLWS